MYFDPLFFLFAAPGAILAAVASRLLRSRAKAMATGNLVGLTGAEVAQRILQANGLTNVRIEKTPGELTDYYHTKQKKLALSDAVHGQRTITALGVAAHEVGHALQDKESYAPLTLRHTIAPFAVRGQQVALILLPVGMILSAVVGQRLYVAEIACVLFGLFMLFTLITLPVEFNASSRALEELARLQLSGGEEWEKTQKVLNAAALTYVAAAAASIGTFLYFLYRTQAPRH